MPTPRRDPAIRAASHAERRSNGRILVWMRVIASTMWLLLLANSLYFQHDQFYRPMFPIVIAYTIVSIAYALLIWRVPSSIDYIWHSTAVIEMPVLFGFAWVATSGNHSESALISGFQVANYMLVLMAMQLSLNRSAVALVAAIGILLQSLVSWHSGFLHQVPYGTLV